MNEFLRDELWLPFVEPRVLHHGLPLDGIEIPDFKLEDKEENLKLLCLEHRGNSSFVWRTTAHFGVGHSTPIRMRSMIARSKATQWSRSREQ